MINKFILEESTIYLPQYAQPMGEHTDYSNCNTLSDLIEGWKCYRIKTVGKTIKKSTYANYCYIIHNYILPDLGNHTLAQVNGKTIIDYIEVLQQKALAESTIKSILVVLKICLKEGIRAKLLSEELLEYCCIHLQKVESRVLNNIDSISMKEYLLQKDDIFALGVLLCRNTGIRIGELCGLKWGDFNFITNSFCIRRTVSRIANPIEGASPKTVLYIRSPKSATSRREIPIPDFLINDLKTHKKKDNDYLLTGSEYCTEPRNIQKRFKTVLKHCKMQDCNFHAMRHGFATACIDNGTDFKTVSSILGHASVQTTINIYGHSSLGKKQSCINSIL